MNICLFSWQFDVCVTVLPFTWMKNLQMGPTTVLPFLAARCSQHAHGMCPKAYAADELGSVPILPAALPHNLNAFWPGCELREPLHSSLSCGKSS